MEISLHFAFVYREKALTVKQLVHFDQMQTDHGTTGCHVRELPDMMSATETGKDVMEKQM